MHRSAHGLVCFGRPPGHYHGLLTVNQKRISIKDIAEVAGVSHPTVSRALRGQGRMSETTRARIVSIAQDMGYTPSLIARGLVTQRSFCLGLVVPTFADPFHSAVVQGIEQAAARKGYNIFLASTEGGALGIAGSQLLSDASHADAGNAQQPNSELQIVRSLQGRQVDGIVVVSTQIGDCYAEFSRTTGIPVMLINPHLAVDTVHALYHDDYSGMDKIMQHLIERGCRRIAYLGNARAGTAHGERRRAWADSLQRAGLPSTVMANARESSVKCGRYTAELLLQRAQEQWQQPPDGIACYSDVVAIGALAALRDHGLSVPDEVAVTGFDDIDMAAYITPTLTTLRQPRREMGQVAAQHLLRLIEQESDSPIPEVLYTRGNLVVRQSA